MNIDLHCHIKLSKKQEFSLTFFKQSMAEARESGLRGIAVTEHFNTRNFHHIYEALDTHYQYLEHYYDVEDIRLLPGMEVDVAGGGHILVIGSRDSVLMLRHMLTPYTEKSNFIPLQQLLNWCDELDLLTIGAHPYRESNPLLSHPIDQLKRLDALDVNAKDLYSYGIQMRERVAELSQQLSIPYIAGSDTHHPLQFGSVYNSFNHEIESYIDLRQAIKQRQYNIFIAQDFAHRVKSASLVKKLMKELGPVAAAFI